MAGHMVSSRIEPLRAAPFPPPGERSVESARADFPGLRQQVHGKPLVYLDNAATTQKPAPVIAAWGQADMSGMWLRLALVWTATA